MALLAPVVDLLARVYVARVFLLSGGSKLSDWESTLLLFTSEYHVPLLSPGLAAVLATSGELLFGLLLALGLFTQSAAFGLFVINAVAVLSYYSELSESPAAIRDHMEWAIILATLMVGSSHPLSLDGIRNRLP